MTSFPTGFPFELDDRELDKAIAQMLEPENWPGFDDFGRLLPELKLQLLSAGLRERQRREQAASTKRALRVAYATLAVSGLAVALGVIAALTT